ncbi:MAG: DUF6477 family protein [Boseongicola sp.]
MSEIMSALKSLNRPRLLIRAARHGLIDYSRERLLTRLIRSEHTLAPEAAVEKLMQAEALLESDRQSGESSYSIARHIELLSALMAEARLVVRRVNEADPA